MRRIITEIDLNVTSTRGAVVSHRPPQSHHTTRTHTHHTHIVRTLLQVECISLWAEQHARKRRNQMPSRRVVVEMHFFVLLSRIKRVYDRFQYKCVRVCVLSTHVDGYHLYATRIDAVAAAAGGSLRS